MFVIIRNSFVYHEIRAGRVTWCGMTDKRADGTIGEFRTENAKFTIEEPRGVRLCKNCEMVKANPGLTTDRRKRRGDWDTI